MHTVRRCRLDEQETILAIVNAAAARYRGVIPSDCWHDPYMQSAELAREIANGVSFWGVEGPNTQLVGVMGIQSVKDVTLVRHAYVHPEHQGQGIGSLLLHHLETLTDQRILIGTWAAATWAIRFYEAHGYTLIPPHETPALLDTYWGISPRQIETSVVLAKAPPTAPRGAREARTTFECANPILNVSDLPRSVRYYVDVLGFTNAAWGGTDFTLVSRDAAGIYLAEGGQGNPGTWVWVGVENVAALHREYSASGATILEAPRNFPWAYEMKVGDPDGHVLRFGSEPRDDIPFER